MLAIAHFLFPYPLSCVIWTFQEDAIPTQTFLSKLLSNPKCKQKKRFSWKRKENRNIPLPESAINSQILKNVSCWSRISFRHCSTGAGGGAYRRMEATIRAPEQSGWSELGVSGRQVERKNNKHTETPKKVAVSLKHLFKTHTGRKELRKLRTRVRSWLRGRSCSWRLLSTSPNAHQSATTSTWGRVKSWPCWQNKQLFVIKIICDCKSQVLWTYISQIFPFLSLYAGYFHPEFKAKHWLGDPFDLDSWVWHS